MEYESSKERLNTNPSCQSSGKKIDKKKHKEVIDLLSEGAGTNAVVASTGISKPTVLAIKKDAEDNNGFELGTWKKNTARLLSQIVTQGSTRLLDEIENIPAGQLPLAIAIMTDKVMALQDAPTVIVEHRLRVSHEDINAMLKGDVIEVKTVSQSDLT